MAVRYIRVDTIDELFSPVIRPTGNLAIIGAASTGTADEPVRVGSPADADRLFGAPKGSALTRAIRLAFEQSPGPSQVWGVRYGNDPAGALTAVENLDVQFVVIADTPLNQASAAQGGTIVKLAAHVKSVSAGADGRERMGVAMLERGSVDVALVRGDLASERMVYIAHKSEQDAAAAVAGTIAGYPPHVSMLLKPVSIASDPFTSTEIDTINGAEDFGSGPAGNGVNWLVDPPLIPGRGIHLGEGYTGGGRKYIDIVRTIDDISFKLKARLIRTVGSLRISRSGLRSLSVLLEAVLRPLVAAERIEDYTISMPILDLLDADPDSLTDAQVQQIADAQNDRAISVFVSVDYAGAVHRIAITLKFT
ncbi:hypothetical protein HII36_08815 [Nonomuraea sp. NN258]|uniref:hypothetical protein n=1 Tax=Nonomuraea antri TaxID=2730852 RepID=UPI00156991E9|nr:hypothetical protein [Nonomuraea antri]NRQ31940.1 hypothetical protein [Nonomuraea antri]